jgi:hypothetical protein
MGRLLLACALLLAPARAHAQEGAPEYAVKAAFLYNFSKFVEWPPSAFATAADPIVICVLGENPFGPLLADAVRGKKVSGREVAVREPRSVSEAAGCHVIFIASGDRRLDETLHELASQPVLTVSDADSAVERGAIIGLKMDERRVRFEINMIAARRAGLKLSSQLLKVAVRLIGQLP